MNDLIDAARVDGELYFEGKNVYDDDVDPVALRRRIGMVFQHPNPFPRASTTTSPTASASRTRPRTWISGSRRRSSARRSGTR